MEIPVGYEGPKLEIVLRTLKPTDNTEEVIKQVISQVQPGGKVAVYLKDQVDGDLTEKTFKALDGAGITKGEMKELMEKVHMIKIAPEIDNIKVASKFLKWTFDNIVNEIEDIVEVERKIKHSQISNKVEKMLERDETIKKFLQQFDDQSRPDPTILEYPLGILIQSGKTFTPNKINVQSDQNYLNAETIYVNACAKYRDMNIMASRTFLVNPDDSQKQIYIIVNEALDVAIKSLIPG